MAENPDYYRATTGKTPGAPLVSVTAEYDYGLFKVQRWIDANDQKTFRIAPSGYVAGGGRLCLYHALEVVQAIREGKTVFVVEGEKDADRLRSLGLVATTNAMGAGKWRPEYSDVLDGGDVVIVADHDGPGYAHAERVAMALSERVARLRIVKLYDTPIPDKGGPDVSDWLDAGHTVDDLLGLVEQAEVAGSMGNLRNEVGDIESQLEATVSPTPDVDDLVAQVKRANGPDEIAGVFARYEPPTDPMVRATMRERLLVALKGLKSPAGMVDAWLRRSPQDSTEIDRKEAAALVALVLDSAVLFHTPDSEAYASIEFDGHGETHKVRSKRFKLWMRKLFFEAAQQDEAADETSGIAFLKSLFGTSPNPIPGAQAVSDAIATLEGLAVFQGDQFDVHVRIAGFGGYIYIDLANDAWEAVELTPTGWKVVSNPPVKFIRPEGMRPLPSPVEGGSLEMLRRFVPVEDAAWPLIVGFLVGMLRPRGPYIVLNLLGEQGSSKSKSAEFIRRVVDPYSPIHKSKPRSEHDLVIGASRSWVLNFDNLSGLPDWFSDALCRLATGGGYGARMLYSDDDEKLFEAQRPIILNGIEELATRGDLLDRSILVTLPVLADVVAESELDREFDIVHPFILGALLDAVVAALAGIDQVVLESRVRMADAATWMVAAEPGLGLEAGSFMRAYTENRTEANTLTLEASKVAAELVTFLEGRDEWTGTATNLLELLDQQVSDETRREKEWPKTGRGLSGKLRRLQPALRRSGLDVAFGREDGGNRTRVVYITRTAS